jgi:hypothetical protein
MKRKLFSIIGIIIGISLLLGSAYLYFSSGKTVFSSDNLKVNAPETSVTKTIQLKESGNPYKIYLHVTFNLKEMPKENELTLLSYGATFLNGKSQIIEQTSSSYNYRVDRSENADDPKGEHTDTITLFSLSDITTDSYALSIVINPNQLTNNTAEVERFKYEIKSNVIFVHPAFPILGLIVTAVSYFLFPKSKKQAPEKKTDEE